jgi:ADP-ribose pyrophosphatase
MNELDEITLNSKMIFQGNVLNLRIDNIKLPDGEESKREVVEHSGGVTILPITDDNRIIMVKQYRKPVEEVVLELPAGKLEIDEEPAQCAKRELWEETGYRSDDVDLICSFYTTPGYSDELLYLYSAKSLYEAKIDRSEPGEFVEMCFLKREEIIDKIMSGKIKDAKTIIGLLAHLEGLNDS